MTAPAPERPEAFVGSTFGSTSALFYRQGTLILEDGTRLRGVSFGYEGSVSGELVFTTGMVGYPESLTDPSYRGQMLVMTYPIVGNYGVPEEDEDEFGLPRFFESSKVQVAALIVSDYSHHHSHWNSQRSLSQWLTQQRVPASKRVDPLQTHGQHLVHRQLRMLLGQRAEAMPTDAHLASLLDVFVSDAQKVLRGLAVVVLVARAR